MIAIVARIKKLTLQNLVKCDTTSFFLVDKGNINPPHLEFWHLEHIFGKRYFCDTPFDMAIRQHNQVVEGSL